MGSIEPGPVLNSKLASRLARLAELQEALKNRCDPQSEIARQIAKMRSLREAYNLSDAFKVSRWATEEEGETLFWLVKDFGIKQVIEIGSANGWTASWFSLSGVDVWTFDVVDRPKIYLEGLFPFQDLKKRIRFKCMPSPACVKYFPPRPSGPVLYFVDGLHEFKATMEDLNMVLSKAKPGDLVMLHDLYAERGTANAWKRLPNLVPCDVFTYPTRNGMGAIRLKEK